MNSRLTTIRFRWQHKGRFLSHTLDSFFGVQNRLLGNGRVFHNGNDIGKRLVAGNFVGLLKRPLVELILR